MTALKRVIPPLFSFAKKKKNLHLLILARRPLPSQPSGRILRLIEPARWSSNSFYSRASSAPPQPSRRILRSVNRPVDLHSNSFPGVREKGVCGWGGAKQYTAQYQISIYLTFTWTDLLWSEYLISYTLFIKLFPRLSSPLRIDKNSYRRHLNPADVCIHHTTIFSSLLYDTTLIFTPLVAIYSTPGSFLYTSTIHIFSLLHPLAHYYSK